MHGYRERVDWSPAAARRLASVLLLDEPRRLTHVAAVAAEVRKIDLPTGAGEIVEMAAWLHDIGYAESVGATGFHPLDGAVFLTALGAPREVVSLVAHHTGAGFEADERGLRLELARFKQPHQHLLDVLTYADLTTGPMGERMTVEQRVREIFRRYQPDHPVHRAVQRSRIDLLESARRVSESVALSR